MDASCSPSMPWCLRTEQKVFYCKVLPDKDHGAPNTPVSRIKTLKCERRQVPNLVRGRPGSVNPDQDCAETQIPRSPWATPNQMKFQTSQSLTEQFHSAGLQRVLEGSPGLCLQTIEAGRSPTGPMQCQVPPFLSVGKEEPLRKRSIIICLFLQ